MRFASSALKSPTSRNVSTWRSGRTRRWTSALGSMSSIATKPSALCTWSPSATSLQKRHSSEDTDDPLLAYRGAPHADDVSDGSVDEPRRVVVAVPPPRPVDEHDIGDPHLRAPPATARLGGHGAQPRAPFFLDGGR